MVLRWVPFGAKTSRYGSHDLGYRRAAKILQSDAILYPPRGFAAGTGFFLIKIKSNSVKFLKYKIYSKIGF